MAVANAAGPEAPDPAPPARVSAGELARRIAAGEWVVDLRHRRAFAAGHMPGSCGFEYGDSFATYLGWLIPWGTSLTLIGETPGQIAGAQRDLARIGIDRVAGAALACSAGWPAAPRQATYPVTDYPGLAARDRRDLAVLDVRRASERARGSIAGSSTCRSTSSPLACATCLIDRCGCTARAATAPASPPRCSRRPATPSLSSTTTSPARQARAWPSPGEHSALRRKRLS